MNLETQIQESRNNFAMHQCPNTDKSEDSIKAVDGMHANECQNVKVASLENRTNSIEHSLTILTSRLENMQLNFLTSSRDSDSAKPMKIFACNVCEFETTTKRDLKQHTEHCHEIVDDTLQCNQCSYMAIHMKDLNRHVLQMHTNDDIDEVFHCDNCEYSTQYQNKLNEHVKTTHPQRRIRIFYSKRRTNNTKSTTIHQERKHEEVKSNPKHPFPNFKTASAMAPGPENVGEKTLRCQECKKCMKHEDELKLHTEFYHSAKLQE